jgi:hypothetical protein
MSKEKILVFIKGTVPSEADLALGKKYSTRAFRSLACYTPEDFIEPCDGVVGAVPSAYAAKFPVLDKKAEVTEAVPPKPVEKSTPWAR